ncbi:MAG TPA: hypothetical protein VHL53_08725 [Acidimicrobiia bacterium]|nr:hypothetical protein [Acidimicrobiia bacterium]
MKRFAALVIAVAGVTVIPGPAYAASTAPTGALPEQACSPAAPVMGALAASPAAAVATTLCSK